MVFAAMLVAGYHQHKRQWRKGRNVEAIQVTRPADLDITAAELNAMIAAVDSGKPTKAQREKLARCFEQLPLLAKLQGDAMAHITTTLLRVADPGDRIYTLDRLAVERTGIGRRPKRHLPDFYTDPTVLYRQLIKVRR